MIQRVIRILRKHFDKAHDFSDEMNDLAGPTIYEVVEALPSYTEFLDCCRDIVQEIRGVDLSHLVELPDVKELADFIFPFINTGLDDREEQEAWRERAKDLSEALLVFLRVGKHGWRIDSRQRQLEEADYVDQ